MPAALLRAFLPLAEREEVLGDLAADYAERVERTGPGAARAWLWRQVLGSMPPLARRTWWRGWSGFEPAANQMRPGGPSMEGWIIDLRYAARRLLARPLYAILTVLTLALGVGGTAAIFSLVRGLIMEPLPYTRDSELAVFWNQFDWGEQEFLYLRPSFTGFSKVAAWRNEDVTLESRNTATQLLPGISSSVELFDVLGVAPALGRGFREGEDASGAEPVVILSDGLYRQLGGQPSLLNTTMKFDGVDRTIIGVMPKNFWFPDPSIRVWIPEPLSPSNNSGNYALVGRLAPGMTLGAMSAPLGQITARLDERYDYPAQWDKTKNAKLTPVREYLLGPLQPALLATAVAMGLILLIACANVAALMLGQMDGRTAELAVRTALGADRKRLAQQLVAEAVMVGTGAGAVAAILAALSFNLLVGALPLGAWTASAHLDWTLFGGAVLIALLSSLGIALVPAYALWRGDLGGSLARVRSTKAGGSRLEGALVVAEVALAVLLAAGSALLIRSVTRLYAIDPGIETKGLAVVDVAMSASSNADARKLILDQLLVELRQLPGVRHVSVTGKLPLRGNGNSAGITIQGQPDLPRTTTYFRIVGPDYFETMGIGIRSGRGFTSFDRADGEEIVVINKALAEKYFPGQDALGRYIGSGPEATEHIVGIVDDVAEGNLTDDAAPARYYVYQQSGWIAEGEAFVIRMNSEADAVAVLDGARRTIERVAPGVAVQEATTMSHVFARAVGPARQVMALLTLLTALALVLGSIGVYGVISHFVERRRRDWGICIALGLQPSRVVRQVVGRGAAIVAIGVAVGLVGVVLMTRLLTSFLFGVGATDPIALSAAAAALLLVGVVAAFIPAWRASRTDPIVVLRDQ